MMMNMKMDKLDIPPVGEFIEMLSVEGSEIYTCKAAMYMFLYTEKNLTGEANEILTVGEIYEKFSGAQIIFT